MLDIKLTFPDGSRTITAKRVFSLTPDGGLLVETTGALVGIDGSKTDRSGTWLYKRAEAENRRLSGRAIVCSASATARGCCGANCAEVFEPATD